MAGRKGLVLTLDAILAAGIMLLAAASFSVMNLSYDTSHMEYSRLYTMNRDVVTMLRGLRVCDIIDEEPAGSMYEEGIILDTDLNRSVMDKIGYLWASGNISHARNLTSSLASMLPDGIGFEILIDDESLYRSDREDMRMLSKTETVISGYSTDMPVSGYMARVVLTGINKRTSSIAYFGGYVGQGNMSRNISIPSDAAVAGAYFEADIPSDFMLKVNGQECGNLLASSEEMIPVRYDLSCPGLFSPGENTVSVEFPGDDIYGSYIGGGYLKVSYTTSEFNTAPSELGENADGIYMFPGITGLVNLYSSFDIPGTLTSISARLHYRSNYTSYLSIGNRTVFTGEGIGETDEILDETYMASVLDLSEISSSTVPIRFGMEDISEIEVVDVGNADVVLVTDLSGSMSRCLDGSSWGCDPVGGENPQRLALVKNMSKEFAATILNNTGNRIALATYSKNGYEVHSLSDNLDSITSSINGFSAGGATCVCCGERVARLMLEEQSNSTRQKYVIVMTDGVATQKCHQDDPDNTESCCQGSYVMARGDAYYCASCWFFGLFCSYECECDACWFDDRRDDCDDMIMRGAVQSAIDDSCNLRSEQNATVYSVGMLSDELVAQCSEANQTLTGIAECGDGEYYSSTNAEELRQIYQQISDDIVQGSWIAQTVNVTGEYETTILYGDSYIAFSYESAVEPFEYGEISLTLESKEFGKYSGYGIESPKEGELLVPEGVDVAEAKLVSYSGKYWTDDVKVNPAGAGWQSVFGLSEYSSDYSELGDPYSVMIPADIIAEGQNLIQVDTGISPDNSTGGSPYSKIIYTARIDGMTGYGTIFGKGDGSTVRVWYDLDQDNVADGYNDISIGPNPSDDFDPDTDAVDNALARMLDRLNFILDSNPDGYVDDGSQSNPIDIDFMPQLEIEPVSISGVPWMWGPAVLEVRSWV